MFGASSLPHLCRVGPYLKGIPGIYMPLTQQVALVYLGRATFVYFLGILLRNL